MIEIQLRVGRMREEMRRKERRFMIKSNGNKREE
jgi:hypothetical protein